MKTILAVENKKLYRAIHVLNTRLLYIRRHNGYYVGVFKSSEGDLHITHVSESGNKFYCTCNYYLITGRPCKHIISMILELKKQGIMTNISIR